VRGAVSNDRPYRDSQRLSLELSLPVGQQPGCRDPLKRGRIGALTQVSYSPKPLEAALEALPVANAAHILCDSLTPSPLVNCRGSRTATQAANALRRGLADRRGDRSRAGGHGTAPWGIDKQGGSGAIPERDRGTATTVTDSSSRRRRLLTPIGQNGLGYTHLQEKPIRSAAKEGCRAWLGRPRNAI
jgi:hypothetical protein